MIIIVIDIKHQDLNIQLLRFHKAEGLQENPLQLHELNLCLYSAHPPSTDYFVVVRNILWKKFIYLKLSCIISLHSMQMMNVKRNA